MTATTPSLLDITRQFRLTQAQLARTVNWSLQPDALLQTLNAAVSAWTPALHLEHIHRGNATILQAIREMLEAPAPRRPETVREETRNFLNRGQFVRGQCAVADFTTPRGVALADLRADSVGLQEGFASLGDRLPEMAACLATDAHPDFGPMTIGDWLRFTEIHTRHHLQIVCEIAHANL